MNAPMMVLALALALTAETKPPEIPIIGETIDVRLINVEVVATSGREVVRGLTAADFRLLIDGKEVPIEFFTEVAEGTSKTSAAPSAAGPAAPVAPAEAVPRSYLVFVDESFSQVESKRPGIAMRARTGFPDLSKKTENARKAESVLLFGGDQNDRKLKVLLGKAKPFGRREIDLPVTVGVPVEALALTLSGRGYIAEAPLAVAALDGQGGR